LTFQPLSEAFVRRRRYSVLTVLDTTGRLGRRLPVASRTGRTEYQFLLLNSVY